MDALTGPFESIVEMACLMHDIGNPPFGHFGEAAINDWFRQRLHPEDAESQPLTHDRCVVSSLRLQEGEENLNDIRRKVRQDICHFEGNAQGIRLVHTLMRMNLTGAGRRNFKIYPSGMVARAGAGFPSLFNEETGLLSF